ncbi:MAG TPA: hypothetical protein VNU46_01660 [Gemmatimonadaceae bacterium]|nr:hypothetical protein [Gemmatimonadaceae bacterium]
MSTKLVELHPITRSKHPEIAQAPLLLVARAWHAVVTGTSFDPNDR